MCVFITANKIIVANLGDSRCVLCRDNKAVPMSTDHKPALVGFVRDVDVQQEEKDRICKAGGFVMNNRVNGDLAVSRTLGDFTYKGNQGLHPTLQSVSCEPDVRIISRDPKDNYVILACDGIWDVFSNPDDMVPVLDNLLMSHETVEAALGGFLDVCLEKGSKDNMTIMLIPLANVPQWEKVGGVMGRPVSEMIEKRIEEEKKKAEEEARKAEEARKEEEEEECEETKGMEEEELSVMEKIVDRVIQGEEQKMEMEVEVKEEVEVKAQEQEEKEQEEEVKEQEEEEKKQD